MKVFFDYELPHFVASMVVLTAVHLFLNFSTLRLIPELLKNNYSIIPEQ